MRIRPDQIISGGQTGADLGGLVAAHKLGIPTGGWAPKGFRTDAGLKPLLKTRFNLAETDSSGYRDRTLLNAFFACGTVIFGNLNSPGCQLTTKAVTRAAKPLITNPTPEELRAWVAAHDIQILNVAGNRERTNPGLATKVKDVLIAAFAVVPPDPTQHEV